MSMMARFVAIAPDRLDAIKKSPDLVEDLFSPELPTLPAGLPSGFEERMRSQAPKIMRDMLNRMPPASRAAILQQLGIKEADLQSPSAMDAIFKRMGGLFAGSRMGGLFGGGGPQPGMEAGERPLGSISLDKAWHGLHYLLCGAIEPTSDVLGQAVLGGAEVGDDLGYGPARYFTTEETAKIAQALQTPDLEAAMRGRFDPDAMMPLNIYPGGWDDEGGEWLFEAFHDLRKFYVAAREAGQAVVTLIE